MRFHGLAALACAPALGLAAGCAILNPPPAEPGWTDERRAEAMARPTPVFAPELMRPRGATEEIRITAVELVRQRDQTQSRAAETAPELIAAPDFAAEARRRAAPPPPPE